MFDLKSQVEEDESVLISIEYLGRCCLTNVGTISFSFETVVSRSRSLIELVVSQISFVGGAYDELVIFEVMGGV